MATVKIEKFGGIAPRLHPTQLADGMAVVAHNLKLENGKLVPLRMPKSVWESDECRQFLESGLSAVEDAKSMHVWRRGNGGFDFLLFGGVTFAAAGNVADDDYTRLVVSGDRDGNGAAEEPVLYLRDNGAKTVVPIRKSAFPRLLVVQPADSGSSKPLRYTRLFATWVDKYGMESPVSPPSLIFNSEGPHIDADLVYHDGDAITVNKPDVKDGDHPDWPDGGKIQKVRIYKVVTGTGEGRIGFVGEVEWSSLAEAANFTITVRDEDVGETVPEIENPPADLSCIQNVPGSFYCGFSPSKRKTVCFSDVDMLYSWPESYRYDVADNIVTLAVTSNSVFALTDGWPYVLSGTAPESMTVAKLANPAACASPRGVCVMDNAVYFASNEGLFAAYNSADAGTVCRNLTAGIFTRDQWAALKPETCMLGRRDGKLLMFFGAGASPYRGYVIDVGKDMKVAVTTHDEIARCLAVDDRTGKMYYVREEA